MTVDAQRPVDAYFDDSAAYWSDVYDHADVAGRIYQRRMALVAAWTAQLGLPPGAPALDVGCGAGLMTVRLAQAGLRVTALDSSDAMVASARRRVETQGMAARVTVARGDAHALDFDEGTFELVVALGVLPWLHDAPAGVAELARVLTPGGHLILTADNRRRLNRLVEPREMPVLEPVRLVKRRLSPGLTLSRRHRPAEVDALLRACELEVQARTTLGYGPFSVLGRRLLNDQAARAVDSALTRAAGRVPRLRGVGWHYVVAARKRGDARATRTR